MWLEGCPGHEPVNGKITIDNHPMSLMFQNGTRNRSKDVRSLREWDVVGIDCQVILGQGFAIGPHVPPKVKTD
jgi:hypothetical protein